MFCETYHRDGPLYERMMATKMGGANYPLSRISAMHTYRLATVLEHMFEPEAKFFLHEMALTLRESISTANGRSGRLWQRRTCWLIWRLFKRRIRRRSRSVFLMKNDSECDTSVYIYVYIYIYILYIYIHVYTYV